MAIENGYATVEEFAEHLGSDRIAEDDPQVERAIEAASRVIDAWTNRRFFLDGETSRRIYNVYDGQVDVDDYTELVSVTPVYGFDNTLGDALTVGTYRAGPLNASVHQRPYTNIEGHFGWGTVSVEAVWGWPSVPAAVKLACLMLAARFYKRRETTAATLGFDDFALRLSSTDPDVATLLEPYARVTVA